MTCSQVTSKQTAFGEGAERGGGGGVLHFGSFAGRSLASPHTGCPLSPSRPPSRAPPFAGLPGLFQGHLGSFPFSVLERFPLPLCTRLAGLRLALGSPGQDAQPQPPKLGPCRLRVVWPAGHPQAWWGRLSQWSPARSHRPWVPFPKVPLLPPALQDPIGPGGFS